MSHGEVHSGLATVLTMKPYAACVARLVALSAQVACGDRSVARGREP